MSGISRTPFFTIIIQFKCNKCKFFFNIFELFFKKLLTVHLKCTIMDLVEVIRWRNEE
uniref:Uncharacterized protein n=1 Tax=Firmicutes phage HS18 TaxID=3056396 RepID=A0AA49X4D0_9VIRU|nr:MAG: hypothetical protein [Firmicutes phage HS18]